MMEQLFRRKWKLGKISLFYLPYILFLLVGQTWSRKMMKGFLKTKESMLGIDVLGKYYPRSLRCIRWQDALMFKEI